MKPLGLTPDGTPITLPDDAITQGFAILARRRSGKSMLAGVMEETFCERGDPWVCLDPVGAHWGIRYRDDGDRPGAPSRLDVLIVGGKQADVPLSEHSGAALAEIIVATDISCIIDLGDTSLNARQKFVADFANELYRVNETPRHLFFEEADEFVPQQLEFDNQKLVRGAIERLIKGGGGRGLGFTLITQRPASVSKKCLTQIDNLFALRMVGPQDLNAVKDWFEHNVGDKEQLREIIGALPAFKPGDAYFLSPDWLGQITFVHVRQRWTYHAGRTPKRGEKPVAPKRVELGKVIEQFRRAAEERQFTVQQEKDLRQENAELRRQLKAVEKGPAAARAVAPPDETLIARRVEQALVTERKASAVQLGEERKRTQRLERVIGEASAQLGGIADRLAKATNGTIPKVAIAASQPVPVAAPAEMSRPMSPRNRYQPEAKPDRLLSDELSRAGPPGDMPTLKLGERKLVIQLASVYPDTMSRSQLALTSRIKTKGSTMAVYLGTIKRVGLAKQTSDGRWCATQAGLDAFGHEAPDAPTTHEAMLAMWGARLKAGERRILRFIVEAFPAGRTREEIAAEFEIETKGSTLAVYLGTLKRNELIVQSGDAFTASEMLWPESAR